MQVWGRTTLFRQARDLFLAYSGESPLISAFSDGVSSNVWRRPGSNRAHDRADKSADSHARSSHGGRQPRTIGRSSLEKESRGRGILGRLRRIISRRVSNLKSSIRRYGV